MQARRAASTSDMGRPARSGRAPLRRSGWVYASNPKIGSSRP